MTNPIQIYNYYCCCVLRESLERKGKRRAGLPLRRARDLGQSRLQGGYGDLWLSLLATGTWRQRRPASSQAGLTVMGGEHQPTYKTFHPEFTCYKICRDKDRVETDRMTKQCLAKPGTHSKGESQLLTPLSILY